MRSIAGRLRSVPNDLLLCIGKMANDTVTVL